MIITTINYEVLRQEHIEANNELRKVTNYLIAIASAMTFARSHFSTDDEWTRGDELISRICGPLEELLHETTASVVIAKTRQKAACQAVSEYQKEKAKTNPEEQQ
jgi:hypothetical protein